MYKKNNNNHVNSYPYVSSYATKAKIDLLDSKILSLMISGLANKEMASRLKVPLSTIQRRTRKLVQEGIINYRAELNLQLIGFKKGLIHIYINNGNLDQIARKISTFEPVESVEIHIGNSDMIGNIIYKDSSHLLQTLSEIKRLDGVEKIVWSEEVYRIQNNDNKISNMLNFKN